MLNYIEYKTVLRKHLIFLRNRILDPSCKIGFYYIISEFIILSFANLFHETLFNIQSHYIS